VNGGTDVLSGFHDKQAVLDILKSGLVSEARADEAARRLLKEQFLLGLFENPYVDASQAGAIVGRDEFRAKALDAQRRSIVLLQNAGQGAAGTLPLPKPAASRPVTLYTMGLNAAVVSAAEYGGYSVVSGDHDAASGQRRPSAEGADYAVLRVEVSNPRSATSMRPTTRSASCGRTNRFLRTQTMSPLASIWSRVLRKTLRSSVEILRARANSARRMGWYFGDARSVWILEARFIRVRGL
jgi:beta-glucosidase-like glycosyl hydrolase